MLDEQGLAAELAVEGGVTAQTTPLVIDAGARVLVARSAVFRHRAGVSGAMVLLAESVRKARLTV
jgi:pentose-5-phosphate-3-epimerase